MTIDEMKKRLQEINTETTLARNRQDFIEIGKLTAERKDLEKSVGETTDRFSGVFEDIFGKNFGGMRR